MGNVSTTPPLRKGSLQYTKHPTTTHPRSAADYKNEGRPKAPLLLCPSIDQLLQTTVVNKDVAISAGKLPAGTGT